MLVASEYRPYIQYHSNRQGNERFSGWAVDVFKYVIKGCVENYELERHNGTWIKMLTSLSQQNSTYNMTIGPVPFYMLNLTHFGVTFTKILARLRFELSSLKEKICFNESIGFLILSRRSFGYAFSSFLS